MRADHCFDEYEKAVRAALDWQWRCHRIAWYIYGPYEEHVVYIVRTVLGEGFSSSSNNQQVSRTNCNSPLDISQAGEVQHIVDSNACRGYSSSNYRVECPNEDYVGIYWRVKDLLRFEVCDVVGLQPDLFVVYTYYELEILEIVWDTEDLDFLTVTGQTDEEDVIDGQVGYGAVTHNQRRVFLLTFDLLESHFSRTVLQDIGKYGDFLDGLFMENQLSKERLCQKPVLAHMVGDGWAVEPAIVHSID